MSAGRKEPLLIRDDQGTYSSIYGPFVLRSAFQPIFSQDTSGRLSIRAFEALVRAQNNGKPVSPPHFFSTVDKSDMLDVDALCRDLHILNMGLMGRGEFKLFVNFNPGIFHSRTDIFREAHHMLDMVRKAGLHPGQIVCEITEQGSDRKILGWLADELRQCRFRIAVDDYGAEGSDIERVDELRPEIVKFDAGWVHRFTETQPGRAMLELMVGQFAARGITVLFEGLEEDGQVDFCRKIGVQLLQGFALARPEIAPVDFSLRFPGNAPSPPKRKMAPQTMDPTIRDGNVIPPPRPRVNPGPGHQAPFGRRRSIGEYRALAGAARS